MVDIGNGTSDANGNVVTGASATATSFGSELYTAGNLLNTNIWHLLMTLPYTQVNTSYYRYK